jgi:hypothetical protein
MPVRRLLPFIGLAARAARRPAWALGAALLLGAAALPCHAEGPDWNQLDAAHQRVLAPLRSSWDAMDTTRKDKWVELAERYPSLSPADQQRVRSRMAEWSALSANQRGQARLHYQEARQVPPAEREARWEAYQSLTETQRRALADRAARRDAARDQPQALLGVGPPAPATSVQHKANLVPSQPDLSTAPKTVSPTTVQAGVGATTRPITQRPSPPAHQLPGLPKIGAQPGFVDAQTLLPKRGPQAAEVVELDDKKKPKPRN